MRQKLTLTFCKVNFRWKKTSPEFQLRRTIILTKRQKKKGCISAIRICILSLLMQIYNIFSQNANVKSQINIYLQIPIVWLSITWYLLKWQKVFNCKTSKGTKGTKTEKTLLLCSCTNELKKNKNLKNPCLYCMLYEQLSVAIRQALLMQA